MVTSHGETLEAGVGHKARGNALLLKGFIELMLEVMGKRMFILNIIKWVLDRFAIGIKYIIRLV